MGLFDFFRRTPPTPARFADLFMQEMRRAGFKDELRYEPETDRILYGKGKSPGIINLCNFFKEYLALPAGRRKQHIADRARLFSRANDETPDDFAEAREHLRPKLWVKAALEKTRLQIRIDGGDASKFDPPEYEVGSHLTASLVYDLPEMMKSVSNEQLIKWGVTYYEALEIARENLEQAPFAYAQIGEGCYASMSGDSYDACRLLLPSRMEQLQVKGDLIAMVPNRDSLLIAGSEDVPSLGIILDLAKKALENPRPMVPMPLRLDGDAWVDWLPERDHPLSAGFRDLARQFLGQEYTGQKELLDRIHEKEGIDIFVASFSGVKKQDCGMFSYAVWSKGVVTLLPKVEWVYFFRGKGDLPAAARWEKVEQVVGHLMKPTEYYPERVLVEEFPSEEELQALGKAEPE
jgi:hypothetical protein